MWSKIKEKFSTFVSKLKKLKHVEILVALTAVALMLLIYFGSSCSSSENASINGADGEYDYYTDVVSELEYKLSQIDGVGEVSVLVYWPERQDDETVAAYSPEGVIIICDGGNDIAVKMKLISSVAAYFGISENKINVLAKATDNKK